ncbi:MAG: hypothetical protein ABIR06_02150, partial [Cyclobacteriaceae bacterium]
MRRPSRSGLSLVFALCANIPLAGQNLESIGKEKPISLTGGISLNQIFYSASGIESRRDPYSYFTSGNVNLSVYGWAVPFSFNISNQNNSFSQPFNQYSLHPTYKSVTTHLGYTSMSFSPYTVNGHIFLGAGVDILPEGNWKFSALYGRFLKAVQADSLNDSSQPSFERMGYGIKSTYGNGRNSIDLILFHAYDDANSLYNIPDSLDITPQENLVISLGIKKTLFKNFLLKTELSTSAITKDTRSEKADNAHLIARSGILFESRLSSSFYNAFKTSFDYHHNSCIIGLAYEKIDPQYRTLGAYYFNNDLENITLNGSAGILQGRLNIAGSAGTQRDNLDKSKISTMRRLVGSLNLHYMHSQRLNFSASYSSFQTYTNIRSQFVDINQLTPYDQLDTLNFTQISKNASGTAMYTLPGQENRKQNINIHVTFQDASEEQGKVEQNSGTRFYNIHTAYSITLPPKNLSISITFNGALNQGFFIETKVFGPNASITRSFMNRKLRTSLSSSFNKTY